MNWSMENLNWEQIVSRQQVLSDFFASLIMIVVLLALRTAAHQFLRTNSAFSPETRRRWIIHVRNLLFLMFVIGLCVIWAKELQALAFSLVAVAAAFVIAFKEFILCFLGGMYKASARPFILGDLVEIDGHRGEVIDHDLISTTLVEIGPGTLLHQYTGRMISIPNSIYLSKPVFNETKQSRFVLHTMVFPFKRADAWQKARALLIETAESICAPMLDEAVKSFEKLSEKEGFEMPYIRPRVSVLFPEADEVHLFLRFPTPATRKGHFEQKISQVFVEKFYGAPVEERP